MPPSKASAEPSALVALWQRRGTASALLLPLSLIFAALAALRRALYGVGLRRVRRLPVPVIVVGNITVGGSGKTPLVVHLARALAALGRRPGIVSRGYGGRGEVHAVVVSDDPATVGDEPLLLARRAGCPVFVGRDRAAAGAALLAAHPECDLILADDGLQHYALARDLEIAVLDERGVWNGRLLPAGPLREPARRLAGVDAVVVNGAAELALPGAAPRFRMHLIGAEFYRLDAPANRASAGELAGLRLHAVAGIGAPPRFFAHLRSLGLKVVEHPFPDHHAYVESELQFAGDAILATEKDAVKLAPLALPLPVWVLPVTAEVAPDLPRFLLEKLHGLAPA